VPLWIEALVGALLVASGIASIVAAVGLVRLRSFFMRMHPPALASTFRRLGSRAGVDAWFSALASRPVLHAWVIPILMAITVPVTTASLARAAVQETAGRPGRSPPLSKR
jgi:multicomponent K+:H+ antiporter subunit G